MRAEHIGPELINIFNPHRKPIPGEHVDATPRLIHGSGVMFIGGRIGRETDAAEPDEKLGVRSDTRQPSPTSPLIDHSAGPGGHAMARQSRRSGPEDVPAFELDPEAIEGWWHAWRSPVTPQRISI